MLFISDPGHQRKALFGNRHIALQMTVEHIGQHPALDGIEHELEVKLIVCHHDRRSSMRRHGNCVVAMGLLPVMVMVMVMVMGVHCLMASDCETYYRQQRDQF
ncbi:MAG: hypothetical protein ACO34E_17540 [Limisphaerales bacterium]